MSTQEKVEKIFLCHRIFITGMLNSGYSAHSRYDSDLNSEECH